MVAWGAFVLPVLWLPTLLGSKLGRGIPKNKECPISFQTQGVRVHLARLQGSDHQAACCRPLKEAKWCVGPKAPMVQ